MIRANGPRLGTCAVTGDYNPGNVTTPPSRGRNVVCRGMEKIITCNNYHTIASCCFTLLFGFYAYRS